MKNNIWYNSQKGGGSKIFMKKLLLGISALLLLGAGCQTQPVKVQATFAPGKAVELKNIGGLVSKPYTFSPNTVIKSSEINSNFDTLYNLVNGNFTNANISASADIARTKIAGTAIVSTGQATQSITSDTTNYGSLFVSTTNGYFRVPVMTTAERNALTAESGAIVYLSDAGQFSIKEGGSWAAISPAAATALANTTTKGIVQEATDAMLQTSSSTGSTGARTFANGGSFSLTPTANKVPVASSTGYIDNGWINTTTLATLLSLPPQNLFYNFTAGMQINKGQAVALISSSTTSTTQGFSIGETQIYGNTWAAQTIQFTSSTHYVNNIGLKVRKVGSPAGNIVIGIYETSGGLPTGNAVYSTTTLASNLSLTLSTSTFTFSSPIFVTTTMTYAVSVSCQGGDGSNYCYWGISNTDSYPNGASVSSANGGSSWSPGSVNDYDFITNEQLALAPGLLFVANNGGADITNGFVGFANESKSTGQSIQVITNGIVSSLSNLYPGTIQYLANNGGLSSVSTGPVSKIVGVSVSTNTILTR